MLHRVATAAKSSVLGEKLWKCYFNMVPNRCFQAITHFHTVIFRFVVVDDIKSHFLETIDDSNGSDSSRTQCLAFIYCFHLDLLPFQNASKS